MGVGEGVLRTNSYILVAFFALSINVNPYIKTEGVIDHVYTYFFYKKPTAWRVGSTFLESSRF